MGNKNTLFLMVIASLLLSSMLFSSNQVFADLVSGVEESELGPVSSERVLGPQQVGADIDFIFTGTTSGSLGATNFVDKDFTITMWANTGDVTGGPSIFSVPGLAAEVVIQDVGTATVLGAFRVFTNDPIDAVGFSSAGADYYDLFGVPNDGYDLTTNFGPVFDPTPFGFQMPIPTDMGDFDASNIVDGSFVSQLKQAVGGDIIPLDTTMVLAAGAQYTAAWMIPVIVSAIGIGIVLARKF